MIKYVLKQNKNKKSLAFGKWYAFPVVEETMDLAELAKHMEEHNTGFTEAMCLGMMTAMVKCIKEQLLAGKNVKIDNLAIFSVGIRNKEGAKTEAEFTAANNIAGVKLRARATGTLSNANLNSSASVKKASVVSSASTSEGGNTPSGGNSQTGDSSSDNNGTNVGL
ncbi:DNA-binding protein [Prevotella copri]|jgi:predicted histone-like DNA-binding protein|uniref:DNA-binding protein n=1 Tax=Segatella copri TaxID=165179 RepID=A0A6G1U3J2_9BACT|nr:DNA-binding protein [Segatella copri]MQN81987.1 DNA-binding protein [Segatella copri]